MDVVETGLPRAASPEAVGFSSQRLQRLTDAFAGDVARGAIPGAVVAIARHGQVAYFEPFGFRDREAGDRMRHDSVFRAASMTKPVTAAAAMTLVEEGKLQLYAPVAKYLPELANVTVAVERTGADGTSGIEIEPLARAMTVQDLFRHTAGFTYAFTGDSFVQRAYRDAHVATLGQTNAEMVAKLARLPLRYQPGTTFEYGMSTDVLGAVIEAVSGTDLERFVAQRIGAPLGWRTTGFRLAPYDVARLAEPQIDPATGKRPDLTSLFDPSREPRWFSGGGGMLTTAADYLRFAQMLCNGGELDGVRVLGRKTVELMTSDHLPPDVQYGSFARQLGITAPLPELGQGFGLGMAVRTSPGRNPNLGSVGDFTWPGLSGTYWWADPSEALVVVMLLQAPVERVHYRCLTRDLVYQALA
jgi:CubicO group peptidase (beta-lactamase class C family)